MGSIHVKRGILATCAFLIYLYFSAAIRKEGPIAFDQLTERFFDGVWSGGVLAVLSLLGSTKGFIVVALMFLLWLIIGKKDYRASVVCFLAFISGYFVNSLLKNWHQRPRPAVEHLTEVNTLSFPSGNAMIGLILYALVAYFITESLTSIKGKVIIKAAAVLMIILYGVTRIALNVHYPSDIVAGYAAGLMWTIVWIYVYETISKKPNL